MLDSCGQRLNRVLTAIGILQQEERDIQAIRAKINATPQIGIPVLEIEVRRPGKGPYGAYWAGTCKSMQADIETSFFRGAFSRPALRRQGLFSESRDVIKSDEIQISAASAHARLSAIATLRSIGADLPL